MAKIYLGIPSRGRDSRVTINNERWLHDIPEARWFVPEEEHDAYKAAGAKRVRIQEPGHNFSVILNQITDAAHKRGEWAVIMDDDLTQMREYIPGTDRKYKDVSLRYAIETVIAACEKHGAKLGGISSNNNKLFAMQSWERWKDCMPRAFIRSSFMVISPEMDLRFDPELRTKMDYDMSIRNVQKYGLVCRVSGLIPTWGYKSNKGGFQYTPRQKWDEDSTNLLLERYPEYIRRNTKRGNDEVRITRWP